MFIDKIHALSRGWAWHGNLSVLEGQFEHDTIPGTYRRIMPRRLTSIEGQFTSRWIMDETEKLILQGGIDAMLSMNYTNGYNTYFLL